MINLQNKMYSHYSQDQIIVTSATDNPPHGIYNKRLRKVRNFVQLAFFICNPIGKFSRCHPSSI